MQLKQVNLPYLDQTYAALMGDLDDRGLLDETLVVMMSDFGRTPRVNGRPAAITGRSATRWSWPARASAAARVCGASDAHAAYVKDRPVAPADICATIYHCLGIDPDTPIADRAGRPVPVARHGGKANCAILA